MAEHPSGISVFGDDSREYAAAYAIMCQSPEIRQPVNGILVRYNQYNKPFHKAACIFLFLLSLIELVAPFLYVMERPNRLVGNNALLLCAIWLFGFFAFLLMGLDVACGTIQCVIQKNRIYIKRWRFFFPHYRVTVFERNDISAIWRHIGPAYYGVPRYGVKFTLVNETQFTVIKDDVLNARVLWFERMLSAWLTTGTLPS